MECFGKYAWLDGALMAAVPSDGIEPGDVSFYEVIRLREGIPLFFDDHMKRMSDGITTRYNLDHDIEGIVREGLDALVRKESFREINVRVMVTFRGEHYSLHICYIPSSYPDEEMIRKGVRLILFHAERADPGVKILNNRLRRSVNEEIEAGKAYEALLVNGAGFITEGSRSNVFFLTDRGAFHTAPDGMVLQGITRRYVLEIIRQEGFDLHFDAVAEEGISRFRSVFITGTSPMVLPVQSIEDHVYEVNNPVVERIRRLYANRAEESLLNYKLSKS